MNIQHFHSSFADLHVILNYGQAKSSILLSKFPKPFKEKLFYCINKGLIKINFNIPL